MYSAVDFKVDWPKLLFKSRPQHPFRDIIHVATSRCCRDINLRLCSLQLMSSDVATSIPCRDITLCLCRFQWLLSMSRLQSSVATTTSVKSSSSFQTCHSFKEILMSRSPFPVSTSRCCRDIIPLVYAQSSAAYLVIPIATCIKFLQFS